MRDCGQRRSRSAAARRRRTVFRGALGALAATALAALAGTASAGPAREAATVRVAATTGGAAVTSVLAQRAPATAGSGPNVKVTDLRVNGQYDEPLGLDDPSPIFSWRMQETPAAMSHPCRRSGPEVACPADRQTAYQIQVANKLRDFDGGDLVWDSGKVASDAQSGVRYGGRELRSREQVVWRVRVWDADGAPSEWKSTGRWEVGLLEQGDWGAARWIEYPGRTETQPLPIFARSFEAGRNVEKARLYLSGIGVHLATVNGKELTDEVLAPGYSNWQLAAEYRTYDITDELVRGSNTVGVRLGNGTAYVRRSVTNPAVGRTSPYSWWQSVLKGSGTLTEAAPAGATNVMPSSTANYHVGGTINIDTGNGGDNLESRTITNIGTSPTTVAAPNVITGTPPPTLTGANWIWNVAGASTSTPAGTIHLRKTFTVADPSALASAVLRVNADDGHTTFVNGTQVSSSAGANNAWQTSQINDIKSLLVPGTNVIAIAPFNGGNAGSLIAVAQLDGTRIVTDGTWKALPGTTTTPPAGWNTVAFDDSSWPAANVTGPYGIGPWNQNVQTPPGPTTLRVASVQGFLAGHTIQIDTGANQETRVIEAVGTAGANGSGLTLTQPLAIVHAAGAPVANLTNPATGISFTPALERSHPAGALVTGSGNNIAASDPTAGAAVTPRLIARLEITYRNGSTDVVVSDRSWRTAFGAYVTDAWYSGSDYDARREPVGWDEAGSDLSATAKRRDGSEVGWIDAGIAPPPNLATKLVARDAPPVRIVEQFVPKSVTNPAPGTYVFDFGQNFAGWPQLNLTTPVPAGTVIRMSPAEGLANSGSGLVDQGSLGPSGGRGTNMFNTYTAAGGGPETWRPDFQYFGMQFLQVTGLPADYPVTTDLITGFRLQGDAPASGAVATSNERINRIHRMAQYSFASNTMTIFTDCPGREKQSYPADYTMVMGAIERNYDLASYLRGHMRHFAEGQSMADTFMRGNVALKVPVHDVGFAGQFGDEINWGNGIILVPAFLYELYGDTDTMAEYYDEMVFFHDYIVREKAGAGALPDHIVNAALSDWVSAQQTSGQISGTWGYFVMTEKLAKMAAITGHAADAVKYAALAEAIKAAFNAQFYNSALKRYATDGGAGGTTGATQVAQALALDAGLAPEADREAILDYLVENIYAFHPSGDTGPHLSGGTIGLAPTVRALTDGGRDDVLWDVLQQDAQPSYGFFLQPTNANPGGFTTIGEQWNRGASKNHMILAQIEEWFHEGLAGIREAKGSLQYRELVIKPRLVGDLSSVEGSYRSPQGLIRSEWVKKPGRFNLRVEIPANTTAEVWVPHVNEKETASARARLLRTEDGYTVYEVGSGVHHFGSAGSALGS
jgi:alpha-L-rhamnosidase